MSIPKRHFSHMWICVDCMLSRRMMLDNRKIPTDIICAECHKPMRMIDSRIRIPVKNRKKWNLFEKWIDRNKIKFEELEIGFEALTLLRKL